MTNHITHRIYLLAVPLFLTVLLSNQVIARTVNLGSLMLWLLAITTTIWLLNDTNTPKYHGVADQRDIVPIGILGLIGIVLLSYFSAIPWHYHQDEFITAYTSYTLPPFASIDWFSVYPSVWVSQFPVIFHIFQKPFFFLFGPTLSAIRISVWPYYLGTLIYVYFLSKHIASRRIAIITGIIYVCLSPMLYLSSMGLHFISSTFFYTATLFHLFLLIETKHFIHSIFLGIFLAVCYVTYTSSYVALPVVILILTASIIVPKDRVLLIQASKTLVIAGIILAPFVTYAFTVNNFFLQRVNQVNVLWGTWSDIPKQAQTPTSLVTVMSLQIVNAIRSLYLPNIGGIGAYNFGKLALFDPLTAFLFIVGSFIVLYRSFYKRRLIYIMVSIAIAIPFIAGFVFTTHPPPFHRISLIYPLFAFSIATAVSALAQRFFLKFRMVALIIFLIVFGITNLIHTQTMITRDATIYPQNSRLIADYLMAHVDSGTTILVAAYPSFYLPQELLFRTKNRYHFVTRTIEQLLPSYAGEPLILLYPTEPTFQTLQKQFPRSRIIRTINDIPLGDLALFLPS